MERVGPVRVRSCGGRWVGGFLNSLMRWVETLAKSCGNPSEGARTAERVGRVVVCSNWRRWVGRVVVRSIWRRAFEELGKGVEKELVELG